MSEPEIARRCLSCGASVRQRATFCPQCGQLLVKQPPDPQAESQAEPVEGSVGSVVGPAEPSSEAEPMIPEASPDTAVSQAIVMPEPSPDTAVTQAIVMPEDVQHSVPTVAETQPLITQTIRREPTVVNDCEGIARHAGDAHQPATEHHLMARVDRIRKVSSVVIDQAAYDPSLRFLLVAAVLFILFVLLMVLSKVIG